jgi:hypothetical protein
MPLSGAVGALVEKDLRVSWRDPALKLTLLVGLAGPLLFLFFLTRTGPGLASGSPILVLASLVGLTGFRSNAFGFERRGIGLLLGFPVPRWRLLVAKNLATVLFRLPSLLAVLLAGLFVAPPALLPAAAAICLATLLIAAGADNYVSILLPVAVPAPGKNPYGGAGAGGRGLAGVALTALALTGVAAASAPFALLGWLPWLLGAPWLWLASLPLALLGAASVYAMLVAGAERLLLRREPDLLERILTEAETP